MEAAAEATRNESVNSMRWCGSMTGGCGEGEIRTEEPGAPETHCSHAADSLRLYPGA